MGSSRYRRWCAALWPFIYFELRWGAAERLYSVPGYFDDGARWKALISEMDYWAMLDYLLIAAAILSFAYAFAPQRFISWLGSALVSPPPTPASPSPTAESIAANVSNVTDADNDRFHEMAKQLQLTREAVRTWNSKTHSYSHLRSQLVALEVKLGALGIATPPVLGLGPVPLFTDDEFRINRGVWVAFLDVVIPLSQIRDLGSAKERYSMGSAGGGDEAPPVHIPNSEQQRPASPSVQDEPHVRIGIISGTEGGFTITNIELLDVTIAYVDFTLGIPAGEEGTKGHSTSPEARIVRDNEEVKLPQRLRYGDRISVYYANHFLMCGQRLQPTALDTIGNAWLGPWVEYRTNGAGVFDDPGEGLRPPDIYRGDPKRAV